MRFPDISGAHGQAWQEPGRDGTAALRSWLVHVPAAHPFWSWYVVVGCSLADTPGLVQSVKLSPGVTHEVAVHVLDPRHEVSDAWPLKWWGQGLMPVNLREQFTSLADQHAAEAIRLLVCSFCDGRIPPGTDFAMAVRGALEATAALFRRASRPPV